MKKLLVFILILMMVIPVQAFAGISPEEPSEKATGINGMFEILMKTDNQWENAGSLGFGKFQETKEIDLGEYLKGTNALIKISQQGGGASYLDAVFIDGMQAVKANGSEGKVLNKLAKEDLDITPVEDGIILEFSSYKGEGILSVTGRIENELISQEPLQFPLANNYKHKYQIRDFYNYKLNTNYRRIAVDGVLDEVENLEAFAQEYQVPGSGHPAGDTYFWVMNDDENLYVVMDFTPDNTYDGDKDYAKVYINTDEGIKEFKVSVPETTWGSPGFTYTDKVEYEHKVYEFVIPLSEIGNITDELELAFIGYGTASLPDICLPRLAYDTNFGIYLSVYQKRNYDSGYGEYQIFGQFVYSNVDGAEVICDEFQISGNDIAGGSQYPDVAYDQKNDVFLVVWSESNIPSIVCRTIKVEKVDKVEGSVIYEFTGQHTLYSQSEENPSIAALPAIAYDSLEGKLLVVWETYSYVPDTNNTIVSIKGKIVDLNASLDNLPIINISIPDDARDIFPAVCYSAGHKAFLVVWQNFDERMIQGNKITSMGQNPEPNSFDDLIIIVEGGDEYTYSPSISINDHSNDFLVTWGYENLIYGADVDLSNSDPYHPEPVQITPDDSYAYHSASFYDGNESMLCLWNDIIVDSRNGYIRMKTIGQSDIYYTHHREYTDTNYGRPQYNLIDSCGNSLGEILVAYGRDPEQDISDFIGYRFITDATPDYSIESEPDLAYHPELDIYLSVFRHEDFDSEERSSYIYGQLVDNEDNPIGERFLINNGTGNEDPEDDGCLDLPSVAVDKNGDFLVAWAQSFGASKIYASKVTLEEIDKNVYDLVIGEAFRISGNTDYSGDGEYCYYTEYSADIAYNNKEDNFLIVWTQHINDTADLSESQMDIYGSVVSIDGNIINSTFPVSREANDNDQLDQGEASVCYSASDDRYIVTWTEVNIGIFSIKAVVIGDDGEVYFDDRVVIAEDSLNSNVSYNKDKFLITWSDENNEEICGAYYNILNNSPEIINEGFTISAVTPIEGMYDVFPAAYFDGNDRMLCVWNPGEDKMYAQLNYINYEGITGTTFNTNDPEFVHSYQPIAITGNLKGQFLIAYETLKGYMGDQELFQIGYRLIGDLKVDPYLEFEEDPYRVQLGKTIQAKVNYFDGEDDFDVTNYVGYNSADPEIATISTSGAITGVSVGTTTVSAIFATGANGSSTTYSAITNVEVYKKSSPGPSPQKTIIGQVIVDGKVLKDIYAEDLVSDGGIYSFEASKTGDNAKLWLLGSYYKQIADKNPNGVLQLVWNAASYNLPLKSEEVLKEVKNIIGSKVNIILEKVDDEKLIESAAAAVNKLGGKMVSGLIDYIITVEGKSKEVNIDRYNMYVTRTMDNLNNLDAYSTTAMKLLEDDEFTFAPSVFDDGTATIKYRGNGIFAIVNNPKSFSDIAAHWSKMNVEKLAARNIAFGKSDGVFAPNDYITRAEFAVMITRALGITEEEGNVNFEDAQGWYEEDISTAYDAGLINGRGDGKFYPNERIQRKDMAVIIQNALKFADKVETVKNKDSVLSMFTDSSKIDEYAKESVALCAEAGIIMGRNTKEFDPDENATRAEASAIIERMLKHLEFIN